MPSTLTRVDHIWDILGEENAEYLTPDGLIAFYYTLEKRDGTRQRITKRSKAVVHAYLRYIVAKEPVGSGVNHRKPRPSGRLTPRQEEAIKTLQEALRKEDINIVERFELEAKMIAIAEARPQTNQRELTDAERDEFLSDLTREFYLVAKFHLLHSEQSPQALVNVGVSHADLVKAGVLI